MGTLHLPSLTLIYVNKCFKFILKMEKFSKLEGREFE